MIYFAKLLRENRYLRFFASVHLAVILMVAISVIVAVGTVLESFYDAEYAKIAVYHSGWFGGIMVLLWINILLATLARWPFRRHHTGFVITHIGLLTLLVGGMMTGYYGIDGTLRVAEGDVSSSVALPEPIIGFQFEDSPRAQTVSFARSISEKEFGRSSGVNSELQHLFWVKRYIPFANLERMVQQDPVGQGSRNVGVSFKLRSNFFDVSEWLSSQENPVLQMGPATLVLKLGKNEEANSKPSGKDKEKAKSAAKAAAASQSSSRMPASVANVKTKTASSGSQLVVISTKTSKAVAQISLDELRKRPIRVGEVEIRIKNEFRFASVSDNKLVEGAGPEPNPALELEISKGSESVREVIYEKFPSFSLRQGDTFGLKFSLDGTLNVGDVVQSNTMPAGHPPVDGAGSVERSETSQSAMPMDANHAGLMGADAGGTTDGNSMSGGSNVIEFWVDPEDPSESATIVLKKAGEIVGSQKVQAGEVFQTPWMGMAITLGSVVKNGSLKTVASPVTPVKGMPLPPGAVLVAMADGSGEYWIAEGSSQKVRLMGRDAHVFFGRRNFELPFELKLQKFTKRDYPGTETAMSFESLVEVPSTGETALISMNEPLKKEGFTIYQASYVLEPGRPPESVFSINKDPGRPVKYAGSLILSIGIIVFTVMRSRWWQGRKKVVST